MFRMTSARLVALLCFLLSLSQFGEARPELLSRSIYVPVQFTISPELAGKLHVFLNDESSRSELGVAPRTFQFTAYPGTGKFVPERVVVHVEAKAACEGRDLEAQFVVTPSSILSAGHTLRYDIELLKKQAKSHRDLRVPLKVIQIRCSPATDLPDDAPEDSAVAPSPERKSSGGGGSSILDRK